MEISEMVDAYGNQAEQEIVNDLGIRRKGKKYYCPFHNDGKVPNLSYDDKRNMFKCFACGETYDIFDHLTQHHNMSNKEAADELKERIGDTSTYTPKVNTSELRNDTMPNNDYDNPKLNKADDKVIEYLKTRKLSEKTINHFNVKSKDGLIAMPYKNENGDVVAIKYRRPEKYKKNGPKYWFEKNSKTILFNYNNIYDKDSIIITEGEIDAMILYEAGFNNVTSIPTGANSNDEWIQTHWEFLKKLDEIILCFDNDEKGIAGAEEVSRRLNNENKNKIRYVKLKEKDANLEFHKNGKDQLRKLVNQAKFFGNDDYIKSSDVRRNLQVQKKKVTGFKTIDFAINGLINGRTTLITSRTNEGKSTFVNEIIINNIEQGNRVLAYVGEDTKEDYKESLYLKIAGNDENATFTKTLNVRPEVFVKESIYNALDKWADNRLFLHHADDYNNWHHDKVFKAMERAVKKDGVKIFIIDNLMKILVTNANDIYMDQSDLVEKITKFDKRFGTHTIIISHAKKGKGRGYSMSIDDNMGSSNIINKVDNVMSVIRVVDGQLDGEECNYDGVVDILKGRKFGELPRMYMKYDSKTRSLKEVLNPNTPNEEVVQRKLNWQQYLADDVDRNTYEKTELTGKEIVDEDDDYLF